MSTYNWCTKILKKIFFYQLSMINSCVSNEFNCKLTLKYVVKFGVNLIVSKVFPKPNKV